MPGHATCTGLWARLNGTAYMSYTSIHRSTSGVMVLNGVAV
jgi:hypothetical protein